MFNLEFLYDPVIWLLIIWQDMKKFLHIYFYKKIYSSIMHKSHKVETIQISICWWKDKQNVVVHSVMLFVNTKGWTTDTC